MYRAITSLSCLTLLGALVLPTSGWSQTEEQTELPADYAKHDQLQRTKGDPHQRLASRAGKWKVTTQFPPAFGGGVDEGQVTMESVLGGKFLLARGTTTMMGEPMETLGWYGYDTLTDEYIVVNGNSIYTSIYEMRGTRRDDGVIEYLGIMKDAMSPEGRPYRAEEWDEGPDKFVIKVYDGTGQQEFEVFTMTHQRVN